jgi:hypothetical protein
VAHKERINQMVEENQLSEVVSNTATTRELVDVPVKEWGLDQLGAFAKSAIAQSDAIEAALPGMRRTSVLQFYRAGKALWLAREELKPMGMYLKWLDEIGIAHQTAYVRTEFYERVPSEKDLEGLSLSQAKKKFGIGKSEPKEGAEPKKPKPAPSGRPPDPLVLILSATAEIASARDAIDKGIVPEGMVQALSGLHAETMRLFAAMERQNAGSATSIVEQGVIVQVGGGTTVSYEFPQLPMMELGQTPKRTALKDRVLAVVRAAGPAGINTSGIEKAVTERGHSPAARQHLQLLSEEGLVQVDETVGSTGKVVERVWKASPDTKPPEQKESPGA